MEHERELRAQLARLLDWQEAHAGFDKTVNGFPVEQRGVRPPHLPHTAWQLVEHLRLAQRDILDFCTRSDYEERRWPDEYWPDSDAPPSAHAWDASVRGVVADRQSLQQLALDPGVDLFATIPHGTGQTYLRELLLVADHTAYHVGQLVLLRRALGSWPNA
jgi:uncharacterized damage-inducible protein DinB